MSTLTAALASIALGVAIALGCAAVLIGGQPTVYTQIPTPTPGVSPVPPKGGTR